MRRVGVLLLLAGCRPDFGPAGSLVERPRLLAVRAEPAEARPNDTVSYRAFFAAPDGAPATSTDWALCATPKPLGENNVVARACLENGVVPVDGTGDQVTVRTPANACSLFGPDLPPQMPGAPAQRPRDPDATGGYFQPVRVRSRDALGFGLLRLACNLAGASVDVALEFAQRYHMNDNPTVSSIEIPDRVRSGAVAHLVAHWESSSAETFPVLDTELNALRDQRESLRVSWFATGGSFATEVTGRAGDDPALFADNDWTAPETAGPIHLWLVLRDSRGGVAVIQRDIVVEN